MRLLTTSTLELVDFTCRAEHVPPYAILSHTWNEEEVSFSQFHSPGVKKLKGYSKIVSACEQAQRDKLDYIWIDTCCIDKSSSSELSEAINSMFAWYSNAEICYAYLSDVSMPPTTRDVGYTTESVNVLFKDFPGDFKTSTYSQGFLEAAPDEFASSRWWTRGWTLQELLAPQVLIFYSQDWIEIGCKASLIDRIALITGIDNHFLSGSLSLKRASVAKKMSWAANRNTTRLEDQAYSLMGIFDVNMPLLYGEGEKAFIRLQEEVMQRSDDHTLFAWADAQASEDQFSGLLAPRPSCFKESRNFVPFNDFVPTKPSYTTTNKGIDIHLGIQSVPGWSGLHIGILHCANAPGCEGFATIYLKRVARTAANFARVRSNTLGWTAEWKVPERVLVSQSDEHLLRPRIWPNPILALRKGPNEDVLSMPTQNLVSIHYEVIPGTKLLRPFLAKPEDRPLTFRFKVSQDWSSLAIPLDDTLHQWAQQAKSWIAEGIPLLYTLPNDTDLVCVAFELVLKSGPRILVMLGSNCQDELGFDCRLLKHDERDLRSCGRSFASKPMNRHLSPFKVDLGPCVLEVGFGVEFVDHTKFIWVDFEVRLSASQHRDGHEYANSKLEQHEFDKFKSIAEYLLVPHMDVL